MDGRASFGLWLKQRRKALRLTQDDLAERISCSGAMVRKIEAGERIASQQIAELLAETFGVVQGERPAFVQFAQGRLNAGAAELALWQTLHSAKAHPTNLAAPLTTLIGREQEVASLHKRILLGNERLFTLTGPPGIGKTRLSLEVGVKLLDHFRDGVFFVGLASVVDPTLVATTIAHSLGLTDKSAEPPLDKVQRSLSSKQMLLLLDNFEQVLDASLVVLELLGACPHLKVLVTSREALHVIGEQQFPVPALATTDPEHLPPLQTLRGIPAVALFIERAQAVKPDFALTRENARDVAAICERLDGLPLAIELAAARIRLLSPQEMQARLESRLPMLTGGPRNLPVRQRTLRAAIDWSFHLLKEEEQTLFTRLGVFVGGCTLSAAEAICNARGDLTSNVSEGIESLLDKNLLKREDGANGESRFSMLELIREYVLDRLAEVDASNREEGEAIRILHAEYFLALVEEAEPFLYTVGQKPWLDRLDRDHDNLRAALGWLIKRDNFAMANRLAASLWQFWYVQGHLSEGRKWLDELLAQPAPEEPAVRAKMLHGAGLLAYSQGDYAQAEAFYEEGLVLQRHLGNEAEVARLLNTLALVALDQRDFERATLLLEECLVIQRKRGDKFQLAKVLNNLGDVVRHQDNYVRAAQLLEESLALLREIDDKFIVFSALHGLGMATLEQGEYRRARSLLAESLTVRVATGVKWGIDECLEGLAGVAGAEAQPVRSARLFGAARRVRETMGAPLPPAEQPTYERHIAITHSQIDEAAFAVAWAEGFEMKMEQAIDYALEEA